MRRACDAVATGTMVVRPVYSKARVSADSQWTGVRLKIAVVVFPGTNCDEETRYVLGERFGHQVDPVWHRDTELQSYDCVVLPGGFSYGDHLRAGAIARFSPVMQAVERFAAEDRLVLGICNGFQILAEAGLLPGTLLPKDRKSVV